ncbi:MAG: protein kinase, partial [Cyanobacteria bacterium J06639_18]
MKLIDFSLSSLLPKENPVLQNPNVLEGTLAYLAPEQTGRMNRGIDYRTDFYSLGVTFYELLTGQLPFPTTDPMELVHCHIARSPVPLYEVVEHREQEIERSQELGVRSQELGVRSQELGVRSQESGVRSQESGTPIHPSTAIPKVLSDIVLKLMAKTAEERYQSAFGLRYDLERCQQAWQARGEMPDFALGDQDVCDRFT